MTDETKDHPSAISVVLVHGAFADGSSWRHIIPLLEDDGYLVTAVQNPLTSFAADVAATRRVIMAQPGPVILVGHSYGGAVITAAAVDAPNVRGLVYVAGFAPDAGERLQTLLMAHPSKLAAALVSDSGGFLAIDRTKFAEVFAGDVPERECRSMAAVQKPINSQSFTHVFGTPAWRHVPSWYLIATEDQALHPHLQEMFAARMDATIHRVETSHLPLVSNPVALAGIIQAAAASIDRTVVPSVRPMVRAYVEHVLHTSPVKPTIH